MPIVDVYSAMDTGVIDGMLGGASVVFSFKLMDIAKYYTFGGPWSTSPLALCMNMKVWNDLSPAHQKIIQETSQMKLGLIGAKAYDAKYQAAVETIEKKPNLELIRLSESEMERFAQASKPVFNEWIVDMEKQGIAAKEIITTIKATQ
jgi:TRAP-type C4-dicarboxylate transport system substrate-binding protein